RHRPGPDDADLLDRTQDDALRSASAGRPVVGDDRRAARALVRVEAAPALAALEAGAHHLLDDRLGSVQAVTTLLVHRVEDLVCGVEPDEVEKGERSHRVAAAVAHGGVDVLPAGVLALKHRD